MCVCVLVCVCVCMFVCVRAETTEMLLIFSGDHHFLSAFSLGCLTFFLNSVLGLHH